MKKRSKMENIFMVFLLILMLFKTDSISAIAYSDEKPLNVGDTVEANNKMPRWIYTYYTDQGLNIDSITAYTECNISLFAEDTVNRISAYMYLEKKTGNSTYTIMRSWSKAVDDNYLSLSQGLFLTERGTYRVHGQYYVYNNDGKCEIIDVYSDVKFY